MLNRPELILLALLVTVAAVYDIRERRIPNWLVLAGIIAGFMSNAFLAALYGLGVGFLLYFPLYLLRARGAGDVKLLAAVGSITGPHNCLWIFLWTAILGGVIALILVAIRGRVRHTLFNTAWIMSDLIRLRAPWKSSPELDVTTTKGLRLPHAAMIAVGSYAFIAMARGQ